MARPKLPSVTKPAVSKASPPEEKNLIVTHSMQVGRVPSVADTGLTAPSLAISHKDANLPQEFGNVTLVLHPKKINPKRDPIYSGDAYTARKMFSIYDKPVLNEERTKKYLDELRNKSYTDIKNNRFPKEQEKEDLLDVDKKLIPYTRRSIENSVSSLSFEHNPYAHLFDKKKMVGHTNGDWEMEWEDTPQFKKKLAQKIMGRGDVRGKEYGPGGLRGLLKIKDYSSALDMALLDRLRSYDDIKVKGKERLVSSPQEKSSHVNFTDRVLPHYGDVEALRGVVARAGHKGIRHSEQLLKESSGPELEDLPKERVSVLGKVLDKFADELRSSKSDYFEAKPRRHFSLGDFSAAVVPRQWLDEYKDIFAQHGVRAIPYSTQEEKMAALKGVAEMDNLLLSEKDEGLAELIKSELLNKLEELAKSEEGNSQEPNEELSDNNKCVLTIVTNGIGQMLFIKRADNGKYSVCTGHLDDNESPEDGARRELLEETGLSPEYLTRIYESHNPNLICYSAQVNYNQPIHNRNDPDQEGKPMWVDVRNGIPQNIYDNLAGPDDHTNVVRQLFDKELNLKKSELIWLDAGFMDLSKKSSDEPLAPKSTNTEPPKELKLLHQPKESKEKNLLVVHNTTPEKLEHAHELGGLVSPSIAIHNKKHPFTAFGDITLVAHPEMVNPKVTPVFSADAYTSRHPRANYEVNRSKLKELGEELVDHADKLGDVYFRDKIEDKVKNSGARAAIEDHSVKHVLMDKFLTEKGHHVDRVMKEADIRHPIVKEKPMQDFFLQYGTNPQDLNPGVYGKKMREALKQSIGGMVDQINNNKDIGPSGKQKVITSIKAGHSDLIDNSDPFNWRDYTMPQIIDSYNQLGKLEHSRWGTKEAIENKVKDLGLKDEFDKWAINKVKGIQGTPYIPTTYNRKKAYTPDNILAIMKRKIRGGEGDSNGLLGAKAIGAQKFRSFDQIKNNLGSLVSQKEFEGQKDENNKAFEKISSKLLPFREGNSFMSLDALTEALGESFKRGKDLAHELRRSGFDNVPANLIDELRQYGKDLLRMPTEYFEAKPQRIVKLNEFKGAAIPENTPAYVTELLKQHGITNVEKYPMTEEGRLAAVNRIAAKDDLHLSEADLGFDILRKDTKE